MASRIRESIRGRCNTTEESTSVGSDTSTECCTAEFTSPGNPIERKICGRSDVMAVYVSEVTGSSSVSEPDGLRAGERQTRLLDARSGVETR